jgi:single-strand DNA-binding protein
MSNDLNQCSFIGRLGAEPDTRYMPNGKAITSFSIAVGSQWKNKDGEKQESTEWVNITAFDKLAEICGEYLKKGSQVFIQGRIKTDKYEKDGQTRYSTKIIAETMQMLGGKVEPSQESKPQQSAKPAKPQATEDFPDDLPFAHHGKKGAGVDWRSM